MTQSGDKRIWRRRALAVAVALAATTVGAGAALSAPGDSPPPIRCGAVPRPACPAVGVSLLISRVSGKVVYRVPGGARRRLTGPLLVPVGTTVDPGARGRFRVTGATGDAKNQFATSDFYGGAVKLTQTTLGGVIDVALVGGNFRSCGRIASAAARSRRGRSVRHVWGSGHGRFQTRGRQAAAAVRGTIWLTDDLCNGTLVAVRRGRVLVTDFGRLSTVFVNAGHSYFADGTPGSHRAFRFTVNCPSHGAAVGSTATISGVFTPSNRAEPLDVTYAPPAGPPFTHRVLVDGFGNYSDNVTVNSLGTWTVTVRNVVVAHRRNPAVCSFSTF